MNAEVKPYPFTIHDYTVETVLGEIPEYPPEAANLVKKIRQRMEREAEMVFLRALAGGEQ